MTSVFVAGSRQLVRLNEQVLERLRNIVTGSYQVLIGDANGADKAVQSFLFGQGYSKVLVFCSGLKCRNNLGAWPTFNVDVPKGVTGRAFYTYKDIEMAKKADYGLMLWDGKSPGTINNVAELLKRERKVLVYFSPKQLFLPVGSVCDMESLLLHCAPDDVLKIEKKVGLKDKLRKAVESEQSVLHF